VTGAVTWSTLPNLASFLLRVINHQLRPLHHQKHHQFRRFCQARTSRDIDRLFHPSPSTRPPTKSPLSQRHSGPISIPPETR
jgi:hypothetical protein